MNLNFHLILAGTMALASTLQGACFIIINMAPLSTWLPVTLSSIGTALALVAFAYQMHRARFNQSIDLLFRLETNFFGADKIKQRVLAASNNLKNPDDFAEMEDILDFFETVAMLTRKSALDLYVVWHTFDYWI